MSIHQILCVIGVLLVSLTQSKLYQVVSLTRHGARYHVYPMGGGEDTKPLWG